jgi:hypothetical protein
MRLEARGPCLPPHRCDRRLLPPHHHSGRRPRVALTPSSPREGAPRHLDSSFPARQSPAPFRHRRRATTPSSFDSATRRRPRAPSASSPGGAAAPSTLAVARRAHGRRAGQSHDGAMQLLPRNAVPRQATPDSYLVTTRGRAAPRRGGRPRLHLGARRPQRAAPTSSPPPRRTSGTRHGSA